MEDEADVAGVAMLAQVSSSFHSALRASAAYAAAQSLNPFFRVLSDAHDIEIELFQTLRNSGKVVVFAI